MRKTLRARRRPGCRARRRLASPVVRDDGKVTFDFLSNMRRHWDGERLWYDSVAVGDPDPAPRAHAADPLLPWLPFLFEELRSGRVSWYARGPGYYGWSKDVNDWKSNAELVSPAWEAAGMHVFLHFYDFGKRLGQIDAWDGTGEILWGIRVHRVDYDPELPASVFTADLPPERPAFPELCGGLACPDAEPPAPPPPPGVAVQP